MGISKLYPLLMARRTNVSFVSIRVACVNAFSEDDLYPQKTFGAVFFLSVNMLQGERVVPQAGWVTE